MTRKSPKKNKHVPWPISPYMMPNRKGKVAAVKRAGLASLYRGMPYLRRGWGGVRRGGVSMDVVCNM